MDRFENGLNREENFESWDIISDDCEDIHDFEVIKVLRDADNIPPESSDSMKLNNTDIKVDKSANAFQKDLFTTDESGETTDEAYDYEDTKKTKQGIKRQHNTFVEAQANKLTTKKEHKFKRKQTLPEKTILKKNDENKNKLKKCSSKKSRPFINSVNFGALLTAFGLSLIFLNSSDKTQTCPTEQESKNISDTLVDAIKDTKLWTDGADNLFDEEKLVNRYLPSNLNKTFREKKNLKMQILKRIDRKIKQRTRGYHIKPLKNEKKTSRAQTPKAELIGPLTKTDEFNSSPTSSKPLSYRSAVLSNKNIEYNKSSNCKIPAHNLDVNVSKTNADLMNKLSDANVKKFTETPHDLEVLKQNTDDKYSENNNKAINCDLKKKTNCSSIYRDFLKAEMLFKKILNNSYDIPKPKTPTDLAYNIENKINILTEDNINLSNLIEEQETLVKQIQNKIEYKKVILQKRSQQKNILQKRLKFANWMKQKREHEEQKVSKVSLGEKVLQNIMITNLQTIKPENSSSVVNPEGRVNNKVTSKSTTEIATRYELKYPLNEEKYKNTTEEENASYVQRKLNLLKKHEELQRNIEMKKWKLIDEEHMNANRLPEKSDPRRSWTKKKTEF